MNKAEPFLESYSPECSLAYSDRAWYRATLDDKPAGYSQVIHGSFPWTRWAGAYKEYWSVARAFMMESFFRQGFLFGPEVSFKLELQKTPHDNNSWALVCYEPPACEEADNDELL